jgi:outer membrane protein assembly factor BamB
LPAAVWVVAFRSDWLWEPGSPGYRWIYTSVLALAGSVVALAWLPPGARLRLLGAAGLLVAAWLLFRDVPTNMYRKAFRTEVRLAMIAPAVAGALWQLFLVALARSVPARRGAGVAGLGATLVLAAAWGAFALANFLTPAAGVVRAVACFDLGSGERRWLTPLFVGPEEKKYAENSYATPTPCATDALVFAHFGSGYGALDHQGRVLWVVQDEDFHLETRYGASASPVLLRDPVLGDDVLYLHDKESGLGPSYVTRIDPASGQARWYRETLDTHDAYMTPLLVERAGERQLLAVTCDWILGYDPESGERLWKLETPIEQMVPGLQCRGDLLLVSGGTHAGFETCGVRLTGKGAQTQGEVLWRTRRAVPGVASPVWMGDGFYTITDGGIVTCYEPGTGTVRWQERVEGKFWASLVAGDGKIYALSHDGVLTTLAAGPEFQVLAQGEFGSTCRATPAIAGGRVLVRTETELYCFGARE